MRISDWSSDVCSSDLASRAVRRDRPLDRVLRGPVGNPPRLPRRLPAREQRQGGPAVISNLLRTMKDISFERSYNAPVAPVWQGWLSAEHRVGIPCVSTFSSMLSSHS